MRPECWSRAHVVVFDLWLHRCFEKWPLTCIQALMSSVCWACTVAGAENGRRDGKKRLHAHGPYVLVYR